MPALTFVATANTISYCGTTLHFADSTEGTLGLDPIALRKYLNSIAELRDGQCVNITTRSIIRVMVPMHTFGHPVEIDGLLAIARDFNLVIIEDAAESLGSTIEERHTGTFGLLGILSFNGNKTITTGGGAILTIDTNLAQRAKHLTTTAKLPHRWNYVHDEVGYKYRIPNFNSALGYAQLEQLPGFIAAKRQLFENYRTAFATLAGVRLFEEPAECRSNY